VYAKAIEETILKELGKLTPYLRNKVGQTAVNISWYINCRRRHRNERGDCLL